MFDFKKIDWSDTEPWNRPLIERISSLQADIRAGFDVVIQMADFADSSSFRYTCYNSWQYTRSGEKWRTHYFFKNECELVSSYLRSIKVLVFCRALWTYPYQNLIEQAKRVGVKLLYQIDDLLCIPDYILSIGNQTGDLEDTEQFYQYMFGYVCRCQQIAKQVDGFLTTNDYLGSILRDYFNKPYKVIRNALNREQMEVSDSYFSQKCNNTPRDPFTIGYFSGTATHKHDFEIVAPELTVLMNEYRDIRFLLVGYMDFPAYMSDMLNDRVEVVPFVDHIELQYWMGRVDVNIAPIRECVYSNCKSELKFFEAAAVGTVTVASPSFTFSKAICDGVDGFLCKEGMWYETLEKLYLDRGQIKEIAEDARRTICKKYHGKAVLDEIEDAYSFFEGVLN